MPLVDRSIHIREGATIPLLLLALTRQHLLALAALHLQLGFLVDPFDAFVVHEQALLAQLQVIPTP